MYVLLENEKLLNRCVYYHYEDAEIQAQQLKKKNSDLNVEITYVGEIGYADEYQCPC